MPSSAWRRPSAASATSALSGFDFAFCFSPRLSASAVNILFAPEAGVANNLEAITAQDELARASDNQIGVLYRYNKARASLAYSIGRMEAMYAK